jgi:hypothetical protein
MGMMLAAAALVAACGDQGGELREVTERRRAEHANRDTTRDAGADAFSDTSTRIPAFAGDTGARTTVITPADSARVDSARQPPPTTGWGVVARSGGTAGDVVTLRGLRAASNPEGYDRLVLDFGTEAVPRWSASYASRPVLRCGSGEASEIAGERWLRLRLQRTQAHDDQGQPTVRQRELPLNMPALREMEITCDFEGEVEVVLGVSAALPYRVMQLANPTRLVIDVQRQP